MNRLQPPPLARDNAIFLDFDGTLAPLQDDPDTVFMPAAREQAIAAAAGALAGAVAIVSGRDIRDLVTRTPASVFRLGGHGLDWALPDAGAPEPAAAPAGLRDALAEIARAHEGVRLEEKGAVFALHYRRAPTAGEAVAAAVDAVLAAYDNYKRQAGKMVVEAKPVAANKGAALERLMAMTPFFGRRPVMIGDDATDEDAFIVALALGGVAIKVGDGDTAAPYRLDDPDAVEGWLREMI